MQRACFAVLVAVVLALLATFFLMLPPQIVEQKPMANDFSGDSTCKALWRFEPGELLADSKGGNTLVPISDPITSAAEWYEGFGAAYFDNDDLWSGQEVTDANLDAGFPLKSGDTVKQISVALWIKPRVFMTTVGSSAFFCKSTYKRSLGVGFRSGLIRFAFGYNSGSSVQNVEVATSIALDSVYHIGFAVDGIAKTYLLRVYDQGADTATTYSGTFTNELHVDAENLRIGSGQDGIYDEYVIFNDLKTADDFDDIRSGSYEPPLATTGLFDGKLIVYHVTDNLDGSATIKDTTTTLLDGHAGVNTPTNTIDGLTVIQDDATALFDGTLIIPNVPLPPQWAWKMIPPASKWSLPRATPRRDIFICILRKTGLDDYEVPMASMQLRRRDGLPTLVSCVVPDYSTYYAGAAARKDGEIIIMAGSVTADGTRHLSELERATLENVSYDHGVNSSSLSLSGYRTTAITNPRPVDLTGITYYGLQADGKRRVRGQINQFLRPGDTAIWGSESMVVDQIYIAVQPRNAWMEVAGL
jgi:hypothetical protein